MSPEPARLTSVDVLRGATMAAMVIVNTPGDWNNAYWPLLHAEWHGWTPTDLIFPFFVFLLGVSIVLSRRQATVATILKRSAVLYGLGLLLALYPRFNLSIVRVVGVLPRLALCYLFAALAYRAVAWRDERSRLTTMLAAAAALIGGYWILLRFIPAPGGVAFDLTPSGNLGAWIDRAVIGSAHLWRQSVTWDPEGLLSTLPAIGTALTGIAAGIVLTGTAPPAQKIQRLAAAGLAATVAGRLWHYEFPINKNLWTSSYVLFTSGLAALLLAFCYWWIDVRGRRAGTRPFVVLGTNALALFVISGWLVKTLLFFNLYNSTYRSVFAPLGPPKFTSLLFALAALAVNYAILEVLYRRRWFLRA